jgi:hypothetical protein
MTRRFASLGKQRLSRFAQQSTFRGISYVAETLGEDEDWLHELSINMFPEDGCLRVYGVGEDGVPAFTEYGIECLKQIIADERAERRRPRCGRPGRLVRAGGKRRGLHAA